MPGEQSLPMDLPEPDWIYVLSLTQPWASLVFVLLATGEYAKRIETRSWLTHFRGRIAIHAAQDFPQSARQLCGTRYFKPVLQCDPATLPTAAILGTVEIVDCVPITATRTHYDWTAKGQDGRGDGVYVVPPRQPERSFGLYTPGRWAWLMNEPRKLAEPIPARGFQRLWRYTPPAGTVL